MSLASIINSTAPWPTVRAGSNGPSHGVPVGSSTCSGDMIRRPPLSLVDVIGSLSQGAEKGAEEADERGDRRPAPPQPPAAKQRLTACASRLHHQTAPSTPSMLCSRNDLRTVARREIGAAF